MLAPYSRTVPHVDLRRFLGTWYVIAGRTPSYERGAHNATESYRWNSSENRLEIYFRCQKGSFDGKTRELRQKAWIADPESNARWKVRPPYWPLKWDYLVIDLASDYSWAAVGVPNQKYLWIIAQEPEMGDVELGRILRQIEEKGYPVHQVVRLPQKHSVDDRIRLHTLDAA